MTAHKQVPLGSVTEIRSGIGFPLSLQGKSTGQYPFAKVGDISRTAQSGQVYLNSADHYIDGDDLKVLRSAPIPSGSIVFAKIGEAIRHNRRAITDSEIFIDNNAIAITPSRAIDTKFLYHYMRSIDLYPLASSTTVPSIRKSTLEQLPIPLPDFSIQRQIVEVLDRADVLREKRRKSIALLDDLAQSIFLDMFGDPVANPRGWHVSSLGDLLIAIESGRSPKCMDHRVVGDQWGVLKLSSVTTCEYIPSENKALPPGYPPDQSCEVKPGDVLFTRKNTPELVAACAYVRETPPNLMIPDLIFRFRFLPSAPVEPQYIQRLLTNRRKRSKVQELAGGSAASMSNISKARLLELPIEVPPIELQKEFIQRIDRIDSMKGQQSVQLAELDTLFASIQSRAFRGELWQDDVKDL
ncbi:restriction endonuclease subunit S [Nocardia gipuzkoensis]|uniref:restriction endonuclease subunit S n=1 Tax=Nocardia gipuzkoensis TaxID=2749991 RepID=UPI00237E0653|nr:restriction endonuclease subunit S [Nocardia gipuzkoensis]MDE1671264.1 restriction endonuclease subunit S [Nocardia gipuzkoensis]